MIHQYYTHRSLARKADDNEQVQKKTSCTMSKNWYFLKFYFISYGAFSDGPDTLQVEKNDFLPVWVSGSSENAP